MDSTQDTSIAQRLGRLFSFVGLAAAAVVLSVYAAQRQRKMQQTEHSSVDHSTPDPEMASTEGGTQEQVTEVSDEAQELISESSDGTQKQSLETERPIQEEGSTTEGSSTEDDTTVQHIHGDTIAQPLDALTFEELYRLAQRHDVAGRSNMRKAQLLEALQALGIKEAES